MDDKEQSGNQYEFVTSIFREELISSGDLPSTMVRFLFANSLIQDLDDPVVLAVPNTFIADYIAKHEEVRDAMNSAISRIADSDISIKVVVDKTLLPEPKSIFPKKKDDEDGEDEAESGEYDDEDDDEDYVPRKAVPEKVKEKKKPIDFNRYNGNYTFENFVVGDSNKLAHSVAMYVAEHPGKKYNPLYIWGPPGIGKTHLLIAITNRIKENDPEAHIEYIKGEDFTNQLVTSINTQRQEEFREKFRKPDVLLIDDVQFIAGKNSSMEELFHTFNQLCEESKQIIMTSDKTPKELKGLEERLLSRFEGGMVVDIQRPDYELRLAIIRKKAIMTGLQLTPDAESYIAEKLTSNIRQIEGAIKKLSGIKFISDELMTEELVRQGIAEYVSETVPVANIMKRIIEAAAGFYNVTVDDVIGEKRDKSIRLARNAAMYIAKEITDLSFPQIGAYFKKKHSTVISNCNTVRQMMDKDQTYKADIDQILRIVRD